MKYKIPLWLKLLGSMLFIASTSFLIIGKHELMFVTTQLLLFIAFSTRSYFISKDKGKFYVFSLTMTIIFGLSFVIGTVFFVI